MNRYLPVVMKAFAILSAVVAETTERVGSLTVKDSAPGTLEKLS